MNPTAVSLETVLILTQNGAGLNIPAGLLHKKNTEGIGATTSTAVQTTVEGLGQNYEMI